MKNTDKVTLTIGQLKRLIKESYDEDGFIWTLNKIKKWKVNFIKESDTIFDTADDALEDGMIELEKCPDGDYFEIVVTKVGTPENNSRFIVKRAVKTKSGKITAFGLNNKNIFFDENKLNEADVGKWYVQCDPTFFHENHCSTQKKIFDFMEKFDWAIPESAYPAMVKLAKSLGADGCTGFTMNEDESSCFLVFDNEEDALNWANILYDDGTSWPEDYVSDWL